MKTCSNKDTKKQANMKNICVYNVPKVQWRIMRQQIWRDLKVQWAPCQTNIYTIKRQVNLTNTRLKNRPENSTSIMICKKQYKYNEFFNGDLNQVFQQNVEVVLQEFIQNLSYKKVLKSVSKYVEHNDVNNFKHLELYQHQKDIYDIFKSHNEPKFICLND